jgi:hypothetical protein
MPEISGHLLPRRTFARVVSFDLACPICGTADCVRSGGLPWWKGTRQFNPFAVGLAMWRVRRAGNHPRDGGRPNDTIPDRRQLLQLQEAYGLVRAQSRGWREPVNLICTCGGVDDDHRPDCSLNEDEPE